MEGLIYIFLNLQLSSFKSQGLDVATKYDNEAYSKEVKRQLQQVTLSLEFHYSKIK